MPPEDYDRRPPPSVETLNLVLQLCDEYEDAWVWGNRPDLSDFLQRVPDVMRAKIFPHLLELDVDLRKGADESPRVDEYLPQFAEYEQTVRDVFAKLDF